VFVAKRNVTNEQESRNKTRIGFPTYHALHAC